MDKVTPEDAMRLLSDHLRSQQDLVSLDEVARWRREAEGHLRNAAVARADQAAVADAASVDVDSAARTDKLRPWWRRLFKSSGHRLALHNLKVQRARLIKLDQIADQLSNNLMALPASEVERKELLGELRAQKKELRADKSELALGMREIRADARRRSVNAGGFQALTGAKGYAAAKRKSIAAERESSIKPLERQKLDIEQQMLALDRQIQRIERL